jgi:AMMECR1 domain-containing protein
VASDRHPFPPFVWGTLERQLTAAERRDLARSLRGLLLFQRNLTPFRLARLANKLPPATAFVSVYSRGRLRGCYGGDEGGPVERVARAFLRAAHDARFGGVRADERDSLVAQVSYVRRAHLLNPETAADEIEAGTHGVALVRDQSHAVLLLPHVARDGRLGPDGLLDALARKARTARQELGAGALYRFETQDIVVRPDEPTRRRRRDLREDSAAEGLSAAGAWLAALVDDQGRVTFAIDPHSRRRIPVGEMHHGRAAVVIQALAALDVRPQLVARARRCLARDIRAALGGGVVEGWPSDPERVAGTLALAILAGIPLQAELAAFLAARPALQTPWHAAQVVSALGPLAPRELWTLCIADLDRRPFAPWTLIAADVLGDGSVRARAARSIANAIRSESPHRGGAGPTSPPEVAITAVALEALARHRAAFARAAVERGHAFLAGAQLVGDRIYGALDPAAARGAFPVTPVNDALRCDVTAHAVLALVPWLRRPS